MANKPKELTPKQREEALKKLASLPEAAVNAQISLTRAQEKLIISRLIELAR